MPVNDKHLQYEKLAPAWQLMRDLAAGQRAIHAGGVRYLPKLTGETPENYAARLARSGFVNLTWRTIEAMKGLLFRKVPTRTIPAAVEQMLLDVTKSGQPMDRFAELVTEEVETVFKVGVLVDHPPAVALQAGQVVTVAAALAANIRPHMALYPAESIINWGYDWINNRTELSLVVLEETAKIEGGDRFKPKTETRWRVLELVPGEGGHVYRQQVYRKNDKGEDEQVGGDIFPKVAGQSWREIPFEIFGDGLPPLEDLGHVNISHYQSTSDVEHGAHKTALPQHYVTGVELPVDRNGNTLPLELTIGAGDLWNFPNPEAKAGILEYSGQGLQAIEKRIEVKEKYAAILGGRMLEAQKSGVESAETAGIHRGSEQSILQSHADIISLGFERCGRWFARWGGALDWESFVYRLNKDFMPTKLSAQEVAALFAVYQGGGMSFDELFWNLQTGGRVSDGADSETEQTKIANAAPAMAPAPAANADPALA